MKYGIMDSPPLLIGGVSQLLFYAMNLGIVQNVVPNFTSSPEVGRGRGTPSWPPPFRGEVCLPAGTTVQAGRGVK